MGNAPTSTAPPPTGEDSQRLEYHAQPQSMFMKNPNEFGFPYTTRNCSYRTERLELSPSEIQRIDELIENSQKRLSDEKNVNAASGFWDMHLKRFSGKEDTPLKIIIDTDIGTDCDDALAFLTLVNVIKHKNVKLLGVTTNYYPAKLRAAVARRFLDDAGMKEVPVFAGNDYGCGGTRDHFLQGNEGMGLGWSDEQLNELFKVNQTSEAEDFIFEQLKQYPREVVLCSIGMCTNLARTIVKHCTNGQSSGIKEDLKTPESFGDLVGHVVLMAGGSFLTQAKCRNGDAFGQFVGPDKTKWDRTGTGQPWPKADGKSVPISLGSNGEIDRNYPLPASDEEFLKWLNEEESKPVVLLPNHNSSGDAMATALLFREVLCPITVIPHAVTAQYWVEGKSIETLLEATTYPSAYPPEFALTGSLIKEWFKTRGQRGQCPHDPLTVYESIFVDDLSTLTYVPGTFVVTEWASFFVFVPDKNGHHRLAISPREPTEKWLAWLEATMLDGIAENCVVSSSNVEITEGWSS
eukprot:TRINITY_DN14229_c0_g1_i1.p1 TRINITY_DN14229_c0_g1~~TRINITY_DN14229_c0_g1_i1.p1  ORF type:complete len:521 (+),score=105.30 TRINITY_DN14229_c0_g1_i1:73-1635(+)